MLASLVERLGRFAPSARALRAQKREGKQKSTKPAAKQQPKQARKPKQVQPPVKAKRAWAKQEQAPVKQKAGPGNTKKPSGRGNL